MFLDICSYLDECKLPARRACRVQHGRIAAGRASSAAGRRSAATLAAMGGGNMPRMLYKLSICRVSAVLLLSPTAQRQLHCRQPVWGTARRLAGHAGMEACRTVTCTGSAPLLRLWRAMPLAKHTAWRRALHGSSAAPDVLLPRAGGGGERRPVAAASKGCPGGPAGCCQCKICNSHSDKCRPLALRMPPRAQRQAGGHS